MSYTYSPGPSLSQDPYKDLDLDLDIDRLSPSIDQEPINKYEIFLPAVQSLVAALGGYEEIETSPESGKFETVYRPGDSVLGVLKDLKKLWRKDDEDDERTVARCMAKAGLMRELIALLVECTDRGDWGRKVALLACDLIAALTWPIDVASELKEMEDEPDVVTDYASLLRAQLEYKAMILQTSGPLRCLLALMLPSLARPRKDEKDERIISLGLHVVRNLLAIKDTVAEGTATGEKEEFANLQSTLILQLNKLTYSQLLLTLASCADKSDFNPFNVLVLDILHLIFRSVKPKELGQDQERAPLENLSKLLDAEKRQKALISKVGMTRHSRFGTTVAVRAGEQKVILHKQNAIAANAGTILDEVKRKRAQKAKKVDELTQIINFSPDAMEALQSLAKSFIESCFNTFFQSILRDIRMERSKIRPADNVRTFYLTRFFIEYLLVLRHKEEQKGKKEYELSLGLVAEMAEMDSIRWLFSRMKSSMDDKPPAWTELQASLDCFTQVLLLLDAMAMSGEQEDVKVAEIVQDNLYYNGDILDSSLSVISQYKDQSVAYLDSVIHFAYVLLRMLEKYSKNKAFMFIRKRKAARKKRKEAEQSTELNPDGSVMPEEYGNEEEEALQPDKEAPSYAEHAFTFKTFEKRFASEPVTNTLLSYLSRFQEFDDPEQMKRVVGLMHRQVIKAQAEGLYFKVSTLNLFRKIVDSSHTLLRADSSKDLSQLINFVLRKFFKRVAEDPFLIVEAFGSKSRSKWKDISSYKSDDESGDGMGGQRKRIQEKMGQAEIEFKKNKKLSWSKQMEITVAILLKEEHEDWIKWIIEILEIVLAARTEVIISTDGEDAALRQADDSDDDDDDERGPRNFAGPSKEAVDKFTQHDLDPPTESLKMAVTKDSHFRLMLRLLAFDMVHPEDLPSVQADSPGQGQGQETTKWFMPSSIIPSSLSTSLGALKQYLTSPPDLTEDPKDLLRRRRPPRQRRQRSTSGTPGLSEMELDSDTGELVRRVKAKKKRVKKVKEMQTYKSAAFIEDSDDEDPDITRAFFEREQQLRDEMNALAKEQGNVMMSNGTKKRKRTGKGKGKDKDINVNKDEEADIGGSSLPPSSQVIDGLDDEDEEEDVLMQSDEDDEEDGPTQRRKRPSLAPLDSQDDDKDEDESIPPSTARPGVVGKVKRIVYSDEDED
ncbi:topoisomerase 1-associated factor 1 [Kwoniella mangroviensis CBS 8886]|nr:topoisomerase 1-associated factor 1 [Kwoniella mangroviensis CBS 8886]